MRLRSRVRLLALLLSLVIPLSGCGRAALQPFVVAAVPWQDGEVSEYDVLDASGAVIGSASWTWQGVSEGWNLTYVLTLGAREDGADVILGPDLAPIRSRLTYPGASHEATYGQEHIAIVTTRDGDRATQELRRPATPIDNSQTLQTHRALPLAEGYVTQYTNVIPSTGSMATTQVHVVGVETLTTAAGTFATWRVELRTGQIRHDAWYAQDAPHLLIQYHNRRAGSQLRLRRWQPAAGAAWQSAPPGAAEDESPAADAMPGLDRGRHRDLALASLLVIAKTREPGAEITTHSETA
jgi:hypothetical protein